MYLSQKNLHDKIYVRKSLQEKHMTHYVCTGGCNITSGNPGTCPTRDCIKYERMLTICHCSDGLHTEAIQHPANTGAEQPTHQE